MRAGRRMMELASVASLTGRNSTFVILCLCPVHDKAPRSARSVAVPVVAFIADQS